MGCKGRAIAANVPAATLAWQQRLIQHTLGLLECPFVQTLSDPDKRAAYDAIAGFEIGGVNPVRAGGRLSHNRAAQGTKLGLCRATFAAALRWGPFRTRKAAGLAHLPLYPGLWHSLWTPATSATRCGGRAGQAGAHKGATAACTALAAGVVAVVVLHFAHLCAALFTATQVFVDEFTCIGCK